MNSLTLSATAHPTPSADEKRWVILALVALALGLEYFVIPIAGLTLLYRYGSVRYGSAYSIGIPALVSVLFLAMSIGVIRDDALNRAPSSLYSIGIIVGAMVFSSGAIRKWYQRYEDDGRPNDDFRIYLLEKVGSLGVQIIKSSCILFLVGAVYFLVTREPVLRIPTLLMSFSDSATETLRYLASTRIYRSDWGFGSFAAPRFIYFARWDTAGAIIVALAGNFAAAYYWNSGRRKHFALTELATLFLICTTLSRTVIAIQLATTVLLLIFIIRTKTVVLVVAAYFICLGTLAAIAINSDLVESASSFRQYSTNDRFDLYEAAFSQFSESEPLLGVGYKPKESTELEYAVGSHSMILSYLIRSGFVGTFLAVLMFWLIPAFNLTRCAVRGDAFSKTVWPFVARGLLVLSGWTMFQEIDTSILTLTAIMIFLLSVDLFGRPKIS